MPKPAVPVSVSSLEQLLGNLQENKVALVSQHLSENNSVKWFGPFCEACLTGYTQKYIY